MRFNKRSWTTLDGVSPVLLPYLDHELRGEGIADALPSGVKAALAGATTLAIVSELRQRTVLKDVLSRLAARGIETVLLKGAALAHSLYPQPHLRPMSDLDIWVPADRVSEAAQCLLGDFEAPPGASPDGRLSPALSQHRLHAVKSGVRVELHGHVHSFEDLTRARVDTFWQRTGTLVIGNVESRMLCPADSLVHTCLHLGRTNRFANGQLPLLDVRLIVEHWSDRIDWVALADNARADGIAVYLALTLRLARRVWNAPVPDAYFDRIGDIEGLGELEDLAIEQAWEIDPSVPPALERALREPPGRARLTAIAARIFAEPRHWTTDLTIKVPRYIRAWTTGALSGSELTRRTSLAERRGRIGVLISQAEAGLSRAER